MIKIMFILDLSYNVADSHVSVFVGIMSNIFTLPDASA